MMLVKENDHQCSPMVKLIFIIFSLLGAYALIFEGTNTRHQNTSTYTTGTIDELTTGSITSVVSNDTSKSTETIDGFSPTDLTWYNIDISNIDYSNNEKIDHDKLDKCGLNKQIIIWGGHHKVGSTSQQKMARSIKKYCNPSKGIFIIHWTCKRHILIDAIERLISAGRLTNNNNNNDNNNDNELKIHYVNLIRNPVSVIISAFNYHSQSPVDRTDREWLTVPMINARNVKCLFNDTLLIDTIEHYCTLVLNIDITNCLMDNKKMSLNKYYLNLLSLYHSYNDSKYLKFGLYIEFQRWLCDEYKEMFDAFDLVNNLQTYLKYNNDNNNNNNGININANYAAHVNSTGFNFKYSQYFGQAINTKFEYFYKFPSLAMIDEKIANNLRKLENFDESSLKLLRLIPSIDEKHYSKLAKLLKLQDVNSMNKKQKRKNSKITFNKTKINKMLQIQLLLEIEPVCLTLKNKSILFDYVWFFPQYC